MSIHDGHRQRVKDRFHNEGLKGFEPHQILELLLFYCIPRRDTNEVAHRLMKHFGSLGQVLDAPGYELEKIEGMGRNAADFIVLMKEINTRYHMESLMKDNIMSSLDKCGEYLSGFLTGKNKETVCLLCLDAKAKVLDCRVVGEGSINSVGVSTRKILEIAFATNATSVVLAHNHPSGIATPSPEDIRTTWEIAKALRAAEVTLLDHMIIADADFVSFVQSGIYAPDRVE